MANPGPPTRRDAPASRQELRATVRAGAPRKLAVRAGPAPLARRTARRGGVVVLIGAGLGVAAVFFPYSSGPAASNDVGPILLRVLPLVAWVIGGVLVLSGRAAPVRAGGLVAAASVVVFTGFDVIDAGQLVGTGNHADAGLWLSVAANVVAVVGTSVVLIVLGRSAELGRPQGLRPVWLVATAVGCVAAGVGFVPSWQRVHYKIGTLHRSGSFAYRGQFDAGWEVIAGGTIVMIGIVVVPLLGSQWARLRAGGAMILGAVVAFAGIIALAVSRQVAPFGLYPEATLKQLHKGKVTFSVSYEPWFYLTVAGLVVLGVVGLLAVARRDRGTAAA